MLLFKLAFLNIGRNPRRSMITILAVAVGLASLIFLWGFNDGTNEQMMENVTKLVTGHVQIHEQGFEKNLSVEKVVTDGAKIVNLAQAHPSVLAVTTRVKSEALIGTTENSRAVLLVGIDVDREKSVTTFFQYVKQGK